MKTKIYELKLKIIAAMSRKIIPLIIFTLSFVLGRAQITLEYSNDTLAFGDFFCTDIGGGDFKYVSINQKANGFSLYNMDMSPYLTNVIVPTTTDSIKNGFIVTYITKTMFDCDSTNIEYVYESPVAGRKPFKILRTDGTALLNIDSARGPYCFGCFGGAYDLRPVINTPQGTKLFIDILNPSGLGIKIFSLCDELPSSYLALPNLSSHIRVSPNPTSGELLFEINYPNNLEDFELIVVNTNGEVIKKENIPRGQTKYAFDAAELSSGTYFYTFASKKKAYQTGKFVLTR